VFAQLAPHLPLVLTVRQLAIEEEGSDGAWSVRALTALREFTPGMSSDT
jgi:hypothetical protein